MSRILTRLAHLFDTSPDTAPAPEAARPQIDSDPSISAWFDVDELTLQRHFESSPDGAW